MKIAEQISSCTRCPLSSKMPIGCFPVPGMGPKNSKLMIVGEALGEDETIVQEPFVGKAGQMLDVILNRARIDRRECFVTNTVHCRPTKNGGRSNRPPTKDEIQACKIWLWKEIQMVQPEIILALGKVPTYTLLKTQLKSTFKLSECVGKEYTVSYCNATIIPAFHPSYLLQHGKDKVEETVQLFTNVERKIHE